MATNYMDFYEDKSFVSPGSIGGKIKRLRELRGLTQSRLGEKSGITLTSANVRMAQYENNKKIPREKMLKAFAKALEVDEGALFDADLLPYNRMYHALFDIEDFHGLHPVKIGDKYYLEFSGPTILDQNVSTWDYQAFMETWYNMRQQYQEEQGDSFEQKKEKNRQYTLWRAEYPLNVEAEESERIQDLYKLNRIQQEKDALNTKVYAKEESEKIEKAICEYKKEIEAQNNTASKMSEIIYLIEKLLEMGIIIDRKPKEWDFNTDKEYCLLVSFKADEIVNDTKKAKAFAKFVCEIDNMKKAGVNVISRVVSYSDDFYVLYEYPEKQKQFFSTLENNWDTVVWIAEQKRENGSTDSELTPQWLRLNKAITGENDIEIKTINL